MPMDGRYVPERQESLPRSTGHAEGDVAGDGASFHVNDAGAMESLPRFIA